jgi:predicted pyridoxine 5'-phosphate oxidase superfamily flavin-nucleotide-binding protein
MRNKFAEIAFTPAVKDIQEAKGSRQAYSRMAETGAAQPQTLTENEAAFIAARDSFYLATVSETGWPYIQHRGGARGFLQVLEPTTIGFLDYRGNRQYVSTGNLKGSDRVSLFLMDYPNRARLKMLGHARVVSVDEGVAAGLQLSEEPRVHPEAAMLIQVAGYDWNCPQHITERYTVEEMRPGIEKLQARIAELEAQLGVNAGA